MTEYYLRVAGVNLRQVVDDTVQLSVVRGSSLLLREAVKEIAETYAGKLTRISLGASVGLFGLRADDIREAKAVRDDVADLLNLSDNYKHFTFVVDVCATGDEYVLDKETVLALNRFRQVQQLSLAMPTSNTNYRVSACDLDGVRPSQHRARVRRNPGENLPYVSESVKQRHDYGRIQKQEFYRQETSVDGLIDEDIRALRFTWDLQELTGNSGFRNLNDKLALIYIDGNAFGRIQERHCRTASDLRKFDEYIRTQRSAFLKGLLLQFAADQDCKTTRGRIRLETLLWGGDEVILVVPGWRGFRTLHAFYEKSKKWAFEEPLTHAAGLVFCHVKTPIFRTRDLAKKLAEHVKDSPGGRGKNLYDYIVLESIDFPTEPINEFWTRRYGSLAALRQPLEPVNNWAACEQILQELLNGKLPKGQVYTVAQAALSEETAAGALAAFSEQFKHFEKVVESEALNAMRCQTERLFGSKDGIWPWLHLVDLWDYLAPQPGSSAPISRA